MTRFLGRCLAVVSVVAAAGCASMGTNDQVNITTDQSLVSGCQDLGEVSVNSWTRDNDVLPSLDIAARHKGANFVLLKADGSRSGVAYRCAARLPGQTASGGS
jgi:hypothetical protein